MIWRIIATGGALSFLVSGFSVLSDPNCITADIGGGRVVGVTCRGDSYGTWSGTTAGFFMLLIGLALLVFIYWRNILALIAQPQDRSINSPSSVGPQVKFYSNRPSAGPRYEPGKMPSLKVCKNCLAKVPNFWGHCDKCLGTTFRETTEEDLKVTEDLTQVKVCDKCNSEVHVFYPKCFNCEGSTFTHKQVKKKKQSSSVSSEEAMLDAFQESKSAPPKGSNPEFKTCPMCAEDIKFAAKKCRYCQHMLDG